MTSPIIFYLPAWRLLLAGCWLSISGEAKVARLSISGEARHLRRPLQPTRRSSKIFTRLRAPILKTKLDHPSRDKDGSH